MHAHPQHDAIAYVTRFSNRLRLLRSPRCIRRTHREPCRRARPLQAQHSSPTTKRGWSGRTSWEMSKACSQTHKEAQMLKRAAI